MTSGSDWFNGSIDPKSSHYNENWHLAQVIKNANFKIDLQKTDSSWFTDTTPKICLKSTPKYLVHQQN